MALTNCKECGNEVSTEADSCPKCGYKQDLSTLQKKNFRALKAWGIILIVIFIAWFALKNSTPQVPQNSPPAENPTVTETTRSNDTPKVDTDSAEAPLATPHNLNEAIDQFSILMADFNEADYSQGALLLTAWASENMKWSELKNVNSGKYAMVLKDSETERGKKICTSGQIIEIAADSSLSNKIFVGGIADDNFRLYRFVAVGSTGDLVQGSRSVFCGIITGRNDYNNSAGGESHAIHLVGMFDLPENKLN